ncbi:helix-turn-helix domain-containing protein [Microseira wollei]|uniref:Transcriptional regulator n=1 Tax=Microseira wollei NIES-4236 TaxID=2530354 RepID=A0AAV3X9P4_9CYAN|nr:helix-turn-helix transcriptional regulator [Microseira wollei]GET38883.1 transcriptional regulator [Microseira wollei NIES-4236]
MKVERVQAVEVPGLGNKIKEAREADKRSLTQICGLVGMSTANWYRIEQEKNESVPEETLRKIEAVLGVEFGVNFPSL